MTKKDVSTRIRQIESRVLKEYFSTLPYGEPHRVKSAVLDILVPHDGNEKLYIQRRKACKRSMENWLQGLCRIPYVAKLAFNQVAGHELLLPYDNYYSVVAMMPDALLLDHLLRNKSWMQTMAEYYGITTESFMTLYLEFSSVRLARKKQYPDVEDCINHPGNWLKSCKGIKPAVGTGNPPPKPYI